MAIKGLHSSSLQWLLKLMSSYLFLCPAMFSLIVGFWPRVHYNLRATSTRPHEGQTDEMERLFESGHRLLCSFFRHSRHLLLSIWKIHEKDVLGNFDHEICGIFFVLLNDNVTGSAIIRSRPMYWVKRGLVLDFLKDKPNHITISRWPLGVNLSVPNGNGAPTRLH